VCQAARVRDRLAPRLLAPSPQVVLVAALLFAVDQFVYQRVGTAVATQAPLDWTDHLLTTLFIVWALGPRFRAGWLMPALTASVLIDVDHIPGQLGSHILTAGTARPYTHSLLTIVCLLGAGLRRSRWRHVALGAALGVASHLWRDLAEPHGAGVALLWPVSDRTVTTPAAVYLASVAGLALISFGRAAVCRRPDDAHSPMTEPLILIGAGGTAGHVVPALAVADALREAGARVTFAGGERSEQELVPAAGYELHTLRVVPLPRRSPAGAARAAAVDTGALRAAFGLVRRLRPAAVLGAGGYVAGPVGLAGSLRRVPLVLMEADSHLGLTNRALAPLARRVCLAFPLDGRDGDRYRLTGRPVPEPASDRAAARARFGIEPAEPCVLVFGGSQGARSINHAAIEAFAGARFRVLHAAGVRDLDELRSPGPHYDLRGYISDFGEALLAADLVVARAGGSVFEIAAHGRPMVLIPYPHATADHQAANARYFERQGAAIVIPDGELSGPRLAQEVGRLLGDPGRLTAMARASSALARPGAARDIAGEILSIASRR
jgi:UDP-N-acetylglucosamine--N-acetylmuramyl-(pentapeptide) pyrophosphoryl-undecaprenol N-acetylglucosamine transferase